MACVAPELLTLLMAERLAKERLHTELEKDRTQAKGDIREILDRLAEKHGATARDVTVAMRSIDDTLSDLLYDQERMLQHEIEDLSPV